MDKRILELRQQIDKLDEEIIRLLKKRMGISKEVGKLKEELDIPVEDKTREIEIIERLTQQAGRNLSEEQLIRIFTAVFKSSKQIQRWTISTAQIFNLKKTPVVGILDKFQINHTTLQIELHDFPKHENYV